MKDMLILIDTDIIAHAVAHASDGRHYIITNKVTDETHITQYKKDAVILAKEMELKDFTIDVDYSPDPIENALHSCREFYDSIVKAVEFQFDDDNLTFKGYLSGDENFREAIAVTKKYKGNRVGMRKPEHLQACKDYLQGALGCIKTVGQEADDAMGIAASSVEYSCICTIDKDMDTIAGWHYNWDNNEFYVVAPDDADYFFYRQVLMGDTSYFKKEGKDLYDDTTIMSHAYDNFIENARLIHIRRKEGELWEPPEEALTEEAV